MKSLKYTGGKENTLKVPIFKKEDQNKYNN